MYLHCDMLMTKGVGYVKKTISRLMALVMEYTYKPDAKPPGTSKVYCEPEMTFGAKMVTVVKNCGGIYCKKFTNTTGSLVALLNFRIIFISRAYISRPANS